MSDLARDQDSGANREQWREYDDSKFARVEDELPENVGKTAYLVFYERLPSDTIDLVEDTQCPGRLSAEGQESEVDMEEMPAEGELSDGRKETLEEEWSPGGVIQGRFAGAALRQDAQDTEREIEAIHCDRPPIDSSEYDADGDAMMMDA